MALFLGCIADDLTGATDLALMLKRGGMRTVQLIGVPKPDLVSPDAEAVVVALKSRTIPADEAVSQSLESLRWLQKAGAKRFFFKYCSTFDSTDDGNIGPVGDALLDLLGSDVTIACPSFPANGRSVFQGHLFVGDMLLSDSPMRHHPLTPMTDANLVRVLGRQTARTVALVGYEVVSRGPEAIQAALADKEGWSVVDAVDDRQLMDIGTAVVDMPLITGGSGLALGLPAAYAERGLISLQVADGFDAPEGPSAIIAGSCSQMTQAQVAKAEARMPSHRIDPIALANDPMSTVRSVLEWAESQTSGAPVLIYSTAEPSAVVEAQAKLGRAEAGTLIEDVLAAIAIGLVGTGVRRLIVAGGETSGAVVNALGVATLEIGPEIAPGVPWTLTNSERPLALALKSGNFGGPDFFTEAFDMLDAVPA
ncbi:MAG: 3-oxo-tetronate kinase [Pseudomonadota bacterium]